MKKRSTNALIAVAVLLSGQMSAAVSGTNIPEAVQAVPESLIEPGEYPDSGDPAIGQKAFSYESTHRGETEPYPFEDVKEGSRYYASVYWLWDHGLINDYRYFRPENKLYTEDAARTVLHIYKPEDKKDEMGIRDAVSQAKEYGLLPDGVSGAKGLDVATGLMLLYKLGIDVQPIKEIESIPGLDEKDENYTEIMELYRAGVYSGSDVNGAYSGNETFTRGDFAVALAALLEPSLRNKDTSGNGAYEKEDTSPYIPSVSETAFDDVPESSPLYKCVMYMKEYGIMGAASGNEFHPDDNVTSAQFIAAAVRLYEKKNGKSSDFTPETGKPWYDTYIRMSSKYGIYPSGAAGFNEPIKRKPAFFTVYRLFKASELEEIRNVARIPDLSPVSPQYKEVLSLYKAGIANGSDQYGTFGASKNVTRGECASLFYKVLNKDGRSASDIALLTGMKAFRKDAVNNTLPFTDINSASWYAGSVRLMYEAGLMNGSTETQFSPNGMMTLAQAIALAVRVYECYHGLANIDSVKSQGAWYTGYVELAKSYGLIDSSWQQYSKPASREQLAYLVYHTLPVSELGLKNNVTVIPDVANSNKYYNEIMTLYKSGITSGNNAFGDFNPKAGVSRAVVASMFSRLIYPERRISFTLKQDLRGLRDLVANTVSGYSGRWSVYFYDVNSGTEFVINDWRMWSASVVKLFVAATVLESIKNGSLSNSQYIQDNLHDMITWSSNTAWSNLYTRLGGGSYSAGQQKVNAYCDSHGYPNSGHRVYSAPYNTTKAKEVGLFLRRVLNGTNVSPAASNQILSLMKAQERTSKIPAGVPSNIVTANKTGELYASAPVENDAAVVFAPSGTYILVVLTERGSVNNIRNLSSVIYNYLN